MILDKTETQEKEQDVVVNTSEYIDVNKSDTTIPIKPGFPENYLTKEAIFFNVEPILDRIDREWRWPSTVEVDKNKYLILKNATHPDYLALKDQKEKEGGVITQENGKEYVEFKDKVEVDNIYEKDAKKNERQVDMDDLSKRLDDIREKIKNGEYKKTSPKIETHDNVRSLIAYLAKDARNPWQRLGRIMAEAMGHSTYNEIYQQVKTHENQMVKHMLTVTNLQRIGTDILDRNEESLKNTKPLDRESMAIYEQVAEQLLGILYDAPVIAPILLTPFLPPVVKGYALGFINTALKQTAAEARIKGDVDTWEEYAYIFKIHALADSFKNGAILGATFAAPGLFGATTFLTEIILQFSAFELFSPMYGEEITWSCFASCINGDSS